VGTGGGQCDGPNNNAANIRSIFRYEGAYVEEPYSLADAPLPQGCYDEPGIVPYVPTQVPNEMPEQITLGFTNTAIQPGLVQWLINGNPMKVDLVDLLSARYMMATAVSALKRTYSWSARLIRYNP